MSTSGAARDTVYDGATPAQIAARTRVSRVVLRDAVGSTQDLAHSLAAEGAPAGTLVLADRQTAGRGRGGRAWSSAPGAGIWMTLLEWPADPAAVEVLSLRLGIAAAEALDGFATAPVRLKWPNDLLVDGRKLAGILVEARWRDARPEWVAIGFGLNVVAPADVPTGIGLREGVGRVDVLARLVPALRGAVARRGQLDDDEMEAWAARDHAAGRRCVAPAEGEVRGITPAGELRIGGPDGESAHRGGSLVLMEEGMA